MDLNKSARFYQSKLNESIRNSRNVYGNVTNMKDYLRSVKKEIKGKNYNLYAEKQGQLLHLGYILQIKEHELERTQKALKYQNKMISEKKRLFQDDENGLLQYKQKYHNLVLENYRLKTLLLSNNK